MGQFCGHDEVCFKFNNMIAMRRAMSNVEKFYPVVGVTEKMNLTLAVLEKTMPEYFEGATEAYYKSNYVISGRHQNSFRKPVKEETIKLIRQNFTREIEFYDFCKQRL